jgi:hypothetical protein
MLFAIDPGTANIVGAFLALLGVLIPAFIALFFQNKRVHNDNRNDHAETSKKVDELIGGVTLLTANVSNVETRVEVMQGDVTDMKFHLRDHSSRIRDLEQEPQ